jgi:hypothetical protein
MGGLVRAFLSLFLHGSHCRYAISICFAWMLYNVFVVVVYELHVVMIFVRQNQEVVDFNQCE